MATPDAADTFCDMHPQERAWMQAPDAPLIRMRRREGRFSLSGELSPSCAFLDVGLPASGVMHLPVHLLDLPLAAFPAGPGFCSYACSPGSEQGIWRASGWFSRIEPFGAAPDHPLLDLASLWIQASASTGLWNGPNRKEAAQAITIDHGHGGECSGGIRPNNA